MSNSLVSMPGTRRTRAEEKPRACRAWKMRIVMLIAGERGRRFAEREPELLRAGRFNQGRRGLTGIDRSMCLLLGALILLTGFWAGGCVGSSGGTVVEPRPRPRGVYHTVRRHQTLWRICKTYGVDMGEVARINGIRDVNEIKAGQRILIPGAEKVLHVEIRIEDIGPAVRKPTTVKLAKIKGRFVWPVKGQIMKRFGWSQGMRHDGIDVAAPWGTTVKSADSGTVIYSGNEIKGYGNIIIIKHGPVFSSVYGHNSQNLVREGDRVQKGQAIARVGKTGRTKGSHLHFEIRNHNKPIDPLLVLP